MSVESLPHFHVWSLKARWQHICINIYTWISIRGADFRDLLYSFSLCSTAFGCFFQLSVSYTLYAHSLARTICILGFIEHTHTGPSSKLPWIAFVPASKGAGAFRWIGLWKILDDEKLKNGNSRSPGSSRLLSPSVIAPLISLSASGLLLDETAPGF